MAKEREWSSKLRTVYFLCLLFVVGYQSAFADYPYSYDDCRGCGVCCGDKWDFCANTCTSYVAWRLNHEFQNDEPVFTDSYRGPHWGDAENWKAIAESVGTVVDKTPRVGSVAWFSYGHVAFVENVNSDGSVAISEYNYPLAYLCKKHSRSNVWADYYIHIFDLYDDQPPCDPQGSEIDAAKLDASSPPSL